MRRISREVRRQRFERDLSAEALVGGEVHATHAAATQLALNRIRANACPWRQWRRGVREQFRPLVDDRVRKERAGPRVVFEERQHFVTYCRFVRSLGGHPLHRSRERLAFDGGFKEITNAAPLLGGHAG